MRPRYQWEIGRRKLALGERTLVMGVLNVTPDSFSDGGRYLAPGRAVEHGLELLDEGADILDIGGESTRPGVALATGTEASPAGVVSAAKEIDRVLPVIEALRRERPQAVLSIDTYKAEVARAALEAGVEIVNDVSGLTWDARMAATLAARPCGVILMHTRGLPQQWATLPPAGDVVALVRRELAERLKEALGAGLRRESIVLDPGFGFGKRLDENYPLLARFAELHALGLPLLAAVSRKGFLGHTVAARLAEFDGAEGAPALPRLADAGVLGPTPPMLSPEARETATLAATVAAAIAGAHLVRVHAVRPAVEAMAIADAILAAE